MIKKMKLKKIIALILTILMIFSITASSFAYELNDDGKYEFTKDELSTMLNKMKNKDETIAQQDKELSKQKEIINSLEKEVSTLEKTVHALKGDLSTAKEELKITREALTKSEELNSSLERENALLKERIKVSDELLKAEQQSGLGFEEEIRLFAIIYLGKEILEDN